MTRNEYFMNHWGFILEADDGGCRTFTVQAIMTDYLGGTGMQTGIATVELSTTPGRSEQFDHE